MQKAWMHAIRIVSFIIIATTAAWPQPPLTADQIVCNLMQRNQERAAALKSYTGARVYKLHYHGFPGSRDAEMVVEATYNAPASKQFKVVSEKGSKFIINKILKRLLASEQEALERENRKETALTPQNYGFTLEGEESSADSRFYVLHAEPKRKNKFLFRGKIWVDAKDFAVARIEAEPAKNPSFWISRTRIEHLYMKIEDFWLPVKNTSRTNVRLGGTATLTIEYKDYAVTQQATASVQR